MRYITILILTGILSACTVIPPLPPIPNGEYRPVNIPVTKVRQGNSPVPSIQESQ